MLATVQVRRAEMRRAVPRASARLFNHDLDVTWLKPMGLGDLSAQETQTDLIFRAPYDLAFAADAAVIRHVQIELVGWFDRIFASQLGPRTRNVAQVALGWLPVFAGIDPARTIDCSAVVFSPLGRHRRY